MQNGLNSKVWWKSKTILAMVANLLLIWSFHFSGDVNIKVGIANSFFAIAGIIFRSIGDKAITLRNGK